MPRRAKRLKLQSRLGATPDLKDYVTPRRGFIALEFSEVRQIKKAWQPTISYREPFGSSCLDSLWISRNHVQIASSSPEVEDGARD